MTRIRRWTKRTYQFSQRRENRIPQNESARKTQTDGQNHQGKRIVTIMVALLAITGSPRRCC